MQIHHLTLGEFKSLISGTILETLPADLFPTIIAYRPCRVGRIKPAYAFKFAFGGIGRELGQVSAPWSTTLDEQGTIHVLEHTNCRIQSFNNKGEAQSLFPLPGSSSPIGLSIQKNGNIVVTEFGTGLIKIFRPSGELFRCNKHTLRAPYDVVLDDQDRIYVADSGNRTIQVLDPEANFIRSIRHKFVCPTGVALSPRDGSIFVVDNSRHEIDQFDAEGVFQRIFLKKNPGKTFPFSCAVDCDGNVVVAFYSSNVVCIYSPEGELLNTLGTGSRELQSSTTGFNNPVCVTIDSDGNLIVSDYGNHRMVVWG